MKHKTKVILLVISSLFIIFMTTGCSALIEQFTEKTEEAKSKYLLKNSADEANQAGLELMDNGQAREGLEYFQKALEYAQKYNELEPYNQSETSGTLLSDAYNNLSYAYYNLNEYELSLENAEKAIQIPPNESIEYSNRGNAYYSLYQYEEALQDYEKAIELDSTNAYAYYGKGSVNYDQGEYEKALQDLDTYLSYEPGDIDAYLYIIWCHYSLGNYVNGLEMADNALLIDEENIDLYDVKGSIIQETESYEEAERYYKTVADRFHDQAEAQILLGEFYYDNSDFTTALDYFMETKDTFPDNSDLDNWIILCYSAVDDLKKADSYYQKVIEDGSATVTLCNSLGNEYAYQGYYMESIKYFDEAIRIDTEDKEAYINKLYSLYNGKRYYKCIEFGKTVLDKFKNDIDILWYIGESYYNLSDYEEALNWYKRVRELDPDNDVIISYISDAYAILEDYDKAEIYAKEALSINRDNETALNVKTTIADREKPIEEQIKEFIKNDYLYYQEDVEDNLNQLFQNNNMTNEDISNALEKGKKAGDIFTFCIYDDYYDYYIEDYINNVEHKKYDNMDYIRIYDFSLNIDNQVIEILDSIKDPESRIITIYLRQNGGGLTDAANNILDTLLSDCVTCTLIDRDGYTYNYYSDASQIKFKKIYVLVDGQSASASELLTLGLKTYLNNVTIIGSNTYGKGVGQYIYEDKKRKLMVFLVNHFWNVREQNIMDTGITPDIALESDDLTDYIKIIQEDMK